ncbi:MAG: DUF2793 domain-containing protein [Pacificimonas sp.]|jgi:hypothetical protein|nr:DUF2793 domain-containing protein [Pacificimonas sp.]
MSETSARLSLPLLQSAQAQKEVTHNSALARLERWVAPAVKSRSLSSPPTGANEGDLWLLPAAASGAWTGRGDHIAEWTGIDWLFVAPWEGLSVYVEDANLQVVYDGAAWSARLHGSGVVIAGRTMLTAAPQTIADPAGGTVVDAECRAALAGLLAGLRDQGLVAD